MPSEESALIGRLLVRAQIAARSQWLMNRASEVSVSLELFRCSAGGRNTCSEVCLSVCDKEAIQASLWLQVWRQFCNEQNAPSPVASV